MTHIHGTARNQALSSLGGQPFSVQDGKVIYIRVHKLLGDDLAEVSANGQRFLAKLETPLKAGERQWVEVKQTGTGISLQLIPSRQGAGEGMASKLLHHLSISTDEKELTSLVTDLVKDKIPIHKEMLLFAGKYATGKEASLHLKIIMEMAKRNMPFTDRIFLSMKAGEKGDFISMLDTLSSKLNETGGDGSTLQFIRRLQEPLRRNISENLVIKALTGLADSSQTYANRLGHFDLLKSLGFIPNETVMNQWKEGLAGMIHDRVTSDGEGELFKASTEGVGNGRDQVAGKNGSGHESIKSAFSLINKWMDILSGTETRLQGSKEETPEAAAKQLVGLAGKEKLVEMNFSRLEQIWGKGVPSSNQEKIFQMLHHQTILDLTEKLRGDELSKVLKRVIGDFGINYEARFHKGYEIQGQTLKEHLIGLSQHHPASDIRQLADDIVLRMNHQVLHSQDPSPLLTIVQQFPMYLFGRNTDITLQWTGKEKEEGVIDGDYCRVLFYLNMKELDETLIDMQVQHRVISLTVWNDHPAVEALSQPLIPDLKKGLEKLGYQLSAVKVKKPDKHENLSEKILGDASNRTFSGVDVKI
ncbi:hypothetical protein NQ095_09440 [Rossellomorea sp. SC111]|uniref:hypothetical protein n=1 Tax=Rossellomorea sp. SC111 TaxID=2968985 RepID=UPI00215A8E3C|nr:hypothetical protein [Rossellomorea sp. SC111]MCR8848626.1 hypothetical protein [Rossellomorea sp. SC111]